MDPLTLILGALTVILGPTGVLAWGVRSTKAQMNGHLEKIAETNENVKEIKKVVYKGFEAAKDERFSLDKRVTILETQKGVVDGH